MKNKLHKILGILLIGILIVSLTACGGEEVTNPIINDESVNQTVDQTEQSTDTEWAIYWYLCGSDLESEYGAGTIDLLN